VKQQVQDQEQQFGPKQRQDPVRIMPDHLGELQSGVDPFERCKSMAALQSASKSIRVTRRRGRGWGESTE